MLDVAWCYDTGTGVRQDFEEANKWDERAANEGWPVMRPDHDPTANPLSLPELFADYLRRQTAAHQRSTYRRNGALSAVCC